MNPASSHFGHPAKRHPLKILCTFAVAVFLVVLSMIPSHCARSTREVEATLARIDSLENEIAIEEDSLTDIKHVTYGRDGAVGAGQ